MMVFFWRIIYFNVYILRLFMMKYFILFVLYLENELNINKYSIFNILLRLLINFLFIF